MSDSNVVPAWPQSGYYPHIMPLLAQTWRSSVRTPERSLLLALVVLVTANLLIGLGGFGILNGDECLYVESAREMLTSGHWVVPTLNGLPYIEKPPLQDWLLLFAFHIGGGITEVAARSVPFLASLMLALAMVRVSPLLGIEASPWTAAYVYLSSLGVVLMSSVAMPEALLNSLFGAGCIVFAAALRSGDTRQARLAALCLGLAALTKGFLPLALFALIIGAYVVARRDEARKIVVLLNDPLAWILFAGPVLAWVVSAEITLPGSAHRFVVDEHIRRFLGTRWPNDYYRGSPFYYVPRLLLFAFPWAALPIIGWLASRHDEPQDKRATRSFLWICFWVPFVFFSLSQAKANYYQGICLPAFALLTADYSASLLRKQRRTWIMASLAFPVLVLIAALALFSWAQATGNLPQLLEHAPKRLALIGAGALLLCTALFAFAQSGRHKAALLGIGLLIVPVTIQIHRVIDAADPWVSAKQMGDYISTNYPNSTVYLYRDFEAYGGLPIYLHHVVPVIESRSKDLYYGASVVPNAPSLEKVSMALKHPRALVVVLDDREQVFRESPLWDRAVAVFRVGNATLYELHESRGSVSGYRSESAALPPQARNAFGSEMPGKHVTEPTAHARNENRKL